MLVRCDLSAGEVWSQWPGLSMSYSDIGVFRTVFFAFSISNKIM